MTSPARGNIGSDLAAALRVRAVDVGGEDAVLRAILEASAASPQRRRLAPWSAPFGRRTILLLGAAILVAALVAAGIGARLQTPRRVVLLPIPQNGPILVERDGRVWWVDPASGATLTTQDLPALPDGTDAA
ncbi:MAG TPA: hypothetical protein VFN41_00120, partial [Candidatus Limnocylindrales bacterium]|nr:hypothetical protein [Candidatus Limnocylindrales bacterium]